MSSIEQRLQERMVAFIRGFGLHQPDHTPCGELVAVSEAHALMELARDEGLSPTVLAARLRLDRSTVTRLLQHMVARGWLTRERDPVDGRAARLRLTTTGREAATQLAAARTAKFADLLAAVPLEERELVLRALDVLVRALDEGEWIDETTALPLVGAAGSGDPADRVR